MNRITAVEVRNIITGHRILWSVGDSVKFASFSVVVQAGIKLALTQKKTITKGVIVFTPKF